MRSRWTNVFTLGADLGCFQEMILSNDREALMAYARQSADMTYALHCGFGKGVASIALVQGRCVGGGFETAVACDYIFAERHSEFSFPDMRSSQRARAVWSISPCSPCVDASGKDGAAHYSCERIGSTMVSMNLCFHGRRCHFFRPYGLEATRSCSKTSVMRSANARS